MTVRNQRLYSILTSSASVYMYNSRFHNHFFFLWFFMRELDFGGFIHVEYKIKCSMLILLRGTRFVYKDISIFAQLAIYSFEIAGLKRPNLVSQIVWFSISVYLYLYLIVMISFSSRWNSIYTPVAPQPCLAKPNIRLTQKHPLVFSDDGNN